MRITLWGTRGLLPVSGPEVSRYGGNTACVEVRGSDGTLLILDGGTGIRALGENLGSDITRVDILLTNFHLDHIQGLGFFKPLFQSGMEVHLWSPPCADGNFKARLERYLSSLIPVRIRHLPCRLALHETPTETFRIGGFEISADWICHPVATLGFRITNGGVSVAYLPDHEPALCAPDFLKDPKWTSGFDLAEGADLLIHDAQFSPSEYGLHVGEGHSSIVQAAAFADFTRVKRLVTFHHDPAHDDATLDRLTEEARRMSQASSFALLAGIEGASFLLGQGALSRAPEPRLG